MSKKGRFVPLRWRSAADGLANRDAREVDAFPAMNHDSVPVLRHLRRAGGGNQRAGAFTSR
ncbi:hypothetical protein FQ775_23765 [Nitratireductor mangrovi]|uniref:Uncharacterized protein n=1 Tax=Nitratireductor mangrovi TaxID=2599600 RepID=A0A6H0DYE8_9HYPH|nr:hypothetical protein [Nitratireductor mangrovi]QIS94625.1 hypothetical protein FQ775_23765 [Nitratireductor mangrovi]